MTPALSYTRRSMPRSPVMSRPTPASLPPRRQASRPPAKPVNFTPAHATVGSREVRELHARHRLAPTATHRPASRMKFVNSTRENATIVPREIHELDAQPTIPVHPSSRMKFVKLIPRPGRATAAARTRGVIHTHLRSPMKFVNLTPSTGPAA